MGRPNFPALIGNSRQPRTSAAVQVTGIAGIGKSRLVWEFFKYMDGLSDWYSWHRGRCLAYGNVSYSALAESVKAQCEILEDDAPGVAADKVRRSVEALFGDHRNPSTTNGANSRPRDGQDVNSLMQRADEAMYRCKSEAGNRYSVSRS